MKDNSKVVQDLTVPVNQILIHMSLLDDLNIIILALEIQSVFADFLCFVSHQSMALPVRIPMRERS